MKKKLEIFLFPILFFFFFSASEEVLIEILNLLSSMNEVLPPESEDRIWEGFTRWKKNGSNFYAGKKINLSCSKKKKRKSRNHESFGKSSFTLWEFFIFFFSHIIVAYSIFRFLFFLILALADKTLTFCKRRLFLFLPSLDKIN